MQMAYSWSNSRWGPRWRPLLVTSEVSSAATTHKIYLIVLRRKRLSTKGKIVLKYCKTYQISGKGFRQSLPYHRGAVGGGGGVVEV